MLKKILIALAIIVVGIQFIPVERTNPPVTKEIEAPQNVLAILKTSCYNCHSNETEWPWYAYVAPVSFLITSDVSEGRKHVNFTEWDKYDQKKQSKKLEHIADAVAEGWMPLAKYIFIHKEAELDESKIKIIKDWVNSNGQQDKPVRYEKED
jgi:hypothetical protein